jgi:hypothetical protein
MKSRKLAFDDPALRISKLERETLHERAYLEVKKAIMSGAIRPGVTITIRAMAAAPRHVPHAVREALRRLVAERALVHVAHPLGNRAADDGRAVRCGAHHSRVPCHCLVHGGWLSLP